MIKKIVLSVLVLGLFGGGFFYWWTSQADVRELNKTLPKGVSVAKSLYGNEYKVINKIDGYEFKVPTEWHGVKIFEYTPERAEGTYVGTSVNLKGREGSGIIFSIDRFKIKEEVNLETWTNNAFDTFGLVGNFSKDKVGEFDVVKTQENVHLVGMFVYFFKKDSAIYSITNGSEEFIKYIILNGKW
ncbi:MAG: hypothetical protein Q7R84_02525 [bacterium]|nr:hypothetical protein [bacterium]